MPFLYHPAVVYARHTSSQDTNICEGVQLLVTSRVPDKVSWQSDSEDCTLLWHFVDKWIVQQHWSEREVCQFKLDVRGSVHHITICKEKSNKMQQCIKIFVIPYLNKAQHVWGDTLPIIRNLKLHWQPLVIHMWKPVRRCQAHCHCAWQRPPTTLPTTFHVWKTRGCQCSFRLLMMGGVSPETCWASYKYGIIKILIHCCILLDFSLQIVPI